MSDVLLIPQDCLIALKRMPNDSLDSLVTDPPAGISFMGKDWDKDKGGRDAWVSWMSEVMRECVRVLKPGAHALVWAIPRTSHWTATALEDAGFEIRDVVTHLFGSGFPKSLDISKAIDKQNGDERKVLGKRTDGRYGSKFQDGNNQFVNAENNLRKEVDSKIGLITEPGSAASAAWQGFGTALKPASEHWILCRKPCSEKTIAANVLRWGCGGLNIDASRIGSETIKTQGGDKFPNNYGDFKTCPESFHQGRFPANLVLSHNEDCVEVGNYDGETSFQCSPGCAVACLDEQSIAGGMHPAGSKRKPGGFNSKGGWGFIGEGEFGGARHGDSGGASRFFYVAKASKRERNEGCGLNGHPTVKPLKLMTYLIRMVTPPGGIVLDPFAGSGSTGVAAKLEGFHFVGIEREHEYFLIAWNRIRNTEGNQDG